MLFCYFRYSVKLLPAKHQQCFPHTFGNQKLYIANLPQTGTLYKLPDVAYFAFYTFK